MKILVTGGAGFIGSHIAERCARDGHNVYVIDNYDPYYDRRQKERNTRDLEDAGVRIVEADLASDDLAAYIEGDTQAVVHAAAQPGISSSISFASYQRANETATQRLLEAARNLEQLTAFIYLSTSSVYGLSADGAEDTVCKPASYYGVTKLAGEQLALSYYRTLGMPVCALRLFSVYGERERPEKLIPRLVRSVMNNEVFPLYEGSREHERSFTYVGDIVDGCRAALERIEDCRGSILNLGSETTATTGTVIDMVSEALNQSVRIETVPARSGDQIRTSAHIARAREVLSYQPSVSLEEGISREVAWYREQYE